MPSEQKVEPLSDDDAEGGDSSRGGDISSFVAPVKEGTSPTAAELSLELVECKANQSVMEMERPKTNAVTIKEEVDDMTTEGSYSGGRITYRIEESNEVKLNSEFLPRIANVFSGKIEMSETMNRSECDYPGISSALNDNSLYLSDKEPCEDRISNTECTESKSLVLKVECIESAHTKNTIVLSSRSITGVAIGPSGKSCSRKNDAMESNHSAKPTHACRFCTKSFISSSVLIKHERIHTGDKPFSCQLCHRNFSQQSHLRRHEIAHTGVKPHTCEVCCKSFTQSSSLLRHKLLHSDERPFVCALCGRAFRQQSHLRTHERIHSGERPYICSKCHMTFSVASNLRKHERTHSSDRPYACHLCSKAFRQLSSLRTHDRTHSGEKPHMCEFCNSSFYRRWDLKMHQRNHSCENPYVCQFCGRSFTLKSYFLTHERMHLKKQRSRKK